MDEAATREGTRRFRDRLAGTVPPDHFRQGGTGLLLSSIGIGTLLLASQKRCRMPWLSLLLA